MRQIRTDELYKQIVPMLYKAALQGKPYVTISSESHDISLISDLLAKKLIENNGIYKLIRGSRECHIELVPTERPYRYEYENSDYNPENPIIGSSDPDDQSDRHDRPIDQVRR